MSCRASKRRWKTRCSTDAPFPIRCRAAPHAAAGAASRFALSEWATKRWPGTFPLATLLINVTGAFALGLLMTAGGAGSALAQERLLLGTGFLGGYTTFSTLSYDTHSLYRSGQ